jgi:hypothetical protein
MSQPGRKTPTGVEVQQLLLTVRRDKSLIVLDGTGGWGGATRDLLATMHNISAAMCVASEGSTEWTDDQLWKFLNVRSEMWWRFREALDPDSGFEICLPPSTRLMTQLTAPIFIVKGKTMQIESKDDLRKRIGSSTDEADMVIQAWRYRDEAIAARFRARPDIVQRLVHGKTAEDIQAESAAPIDFDDPLGAYRK